MHTCVLADKGSGNAFLLSFIYLNTAQLLIKFVKRTFHASFGDFYFTFAQEKTRKAWQMFLSPLSWSSDYFQSCNEQPNLPQFRLVYIHAYCYNLTLT